MKGYETQMSQIHKKIRNADLSRPGHNCLDLVTPGQACSEQPPSALQPSPYGKYVSGTRPRVRAHQMR